MIKTKITPPVSLSSLVRPRLIDLIQSNYSLIIINAGAGYGKTTLMGQFNNGASGIHVWYRLDEQDRDPGHFISCLVTGLRQEMPDFGKQLINNLAQDIDFAKQAESALAALIAEIEEKAGGPVNIFFDDFQVVNNIASITDAVSFLTRHLPEGSRIFIASRERPRLSLARLRTHRAILEIGTDELRFTLGETARFVRPCRGSRLSDMQVNDLHILSEGWPVALVLSQGCHGKHGYDQLAAKALIRAASDYFAAEIWADLDSRLRTFLMECSLPEVIDPDVCDRALNIGGAPAAGLLKSCEEQNLIVSFTSSAGPTVFRFHPLFRNFLTKELLYELGEPRARELHLSYAEAFLKLANNERAIDHFLLAGDPKRAAVIMESCGSRLLDAGRSRDIDGWLNQIPQKFFSDHPWLFYFQAQLEERWGEPVSALRTLELARREFKRVGERQGVFSTCMARARVLKRMGENKKSLEAAAEALKWSCSSEEKIKAIGELTTLRLLFGPAQKVHDLLVEFDSLCHKVSTKAKPSIIIARLDYLYFTGRFKEILVKTDGLAKHLGCEDSSIPERFNLIVYRALTLFQTGRYRESIELLSAGENLLAGEYAGYDPVFRSLKVLGLLYTDEAGEADRGRQLRDEVFKGEAGHGWLEPGLWLNYLGAFERRQGYPKRALESHNRALSVGRQEQNTYLTASSLVQIAAGKIALGEQGGGEKELDEAVAIADQCGYQYILSQIYFYRARLALRKGQRQKAVADIGACLGLAAGNDYIHFLVREGQGAPDLLSLAFESCSERGWLAAIFGQMGSECLPALKPFVDHKDSDVKKSAVAVIGRVGGPQASASLRQMMRDQDPGVRVAAEEALGFIRESIGEPEKVLTGREMQVLKMLAAGLGNRDIGARIFISEATVKTHVTNIFNKLGISKRSQVAKLWQKQLSQ